MSSRPLFRAALALQFPGVRPDAHPPQLDTLVFAARGQSLAVRAERYGRDRTGVSFQRSGRLAAGHVPQLDALVHAPRGQRLTIWAECYRPDEIGVPSFQSFSELWLGG